MDVQVRTCKICKKPCTEPKYLSCLHCFCKLCLKFQIIAVPTNRQWEGFSCPSCGRYTKAVDPDQPLATWADQFPDSLTKKKPMRKQGSSEDHTDGSSVASPRTPTSVKFPSTSDSEPYSPGPYSPPSPGVQSPGPFSPLPESPGPSDLESTRPASESDSVTSPNVLSSENPDASLLGTPTSSMDDPDVKLDESLAELSIPSPTVDIDDSLPVFGDNENEEKMCTIHPWKPIIVTCKNCNNIPACGQCLVETHPTCKGEDFVPLSQKPLLPDISELEQEVQKVDQANDRITSSAYQLQQTREQIRQKIKEIALLLIQKMKRDGERMVKKVEKVYQGEISRLKSGVSPAEDLLKKVQIWKENTEDLNKQHLAAVVQQSDSYQEEHKVLLEKVKAVDYACVPPDVTFVPNYDTLALTLGDLVADDGYYPKHDIPPVPERPQSIEILRRQSTPNVEPKPEISPISPEARRTSEPAVSPVPLTPPTPEPAQATSSSSKTKSLDSSAKPQKSKSKSIFDKIRSPKQKQSKFFVKFPEL